MTTTNSKKNAFAAVAGAVVGAGVVLAGAVALADKKNMSRVNNFLDKTKDMIGDKKSEVEVKAKKLSKIAKNTKREVKNI